MLLQLLIMKNVIVTNLTTCVAIQLLCCENVAITLRDSCDTVYHVLGCNFNFSCDYHLLVLRSHEQNTLPVSFVC